MCNPPTDEWSGYLHIAKVHGTLVTHLDVILVGLNQFYIIYIIAYTMTTRFMRCTLLL